MFENLCEIRSQPQFLFVHPNCTFVLFPTNVVFFLLFISTYLRAVSTVTAWVVFVSPAITSPTQPSTFAWTSSLQNEGGLSFVSISFVILILSLMWWGK